MIFISYSRDDIKWRNTIEKKLKVISRQRGLDNKNIYWHDGLIECGDPNWKITLDEAKMKSKAVIFLYSENFVASDFIDQEEYRYFLNRRNEVDVYWIVVDRILYENSELYEKNIQACVPKSGRITPIIDMNEDELQEFLFKNLDQIVVKTIKNGGNEMLLLRPYIPQSAYDFILDDRVFNCNRTKETEIFDHCYTAYKNFTSVLCFAIDGDHDDLLETISNTIWVKGIKNMYSLPAKEPCLVKVDKIIDCPPSDGLPHYGFTIRSLKLKLLKQLGLPMKPDVPLTLTVLSENFSNNFFAININVKSTYFHGIVYDHVLAWIRDEFIGNNQSKNNATAAFFFTFEKNGNNEENSIMINYVDAKVEQTNFYEILYRKGNDIPKTISVDSLIYLGTHKNVTRHDLEVWLEDNTAINKVHFDQFFDLELASSMKMRSAVKKLDKFIREYNQLTLIK